MEDDGLLLGLPARLRAGGGLHAPHHARRPGGQRRFGAAAGAGVSRRAASALAVFPELTLSGYSIEDILLQDALLDAVEDALLDVVAGVGRTAAGAGRSARRCGTGTASTTPPSSSTAAGCSASCPKSYLPTYREFYERRQIAAGDDERGAIRIGDARRAVRSGPVVRRDRPARASSCTSRSARTCSCRCRRARRRRWQARPCWPTCPAARSRSAAPTTAACWPARRRRAAWPPTSTPPRARANPPPTWPGTARR